MTSIHTNIVHLAKLFFVSILFVLNIDKAAAAYAKSGFYHDSILVKVSFTKSKGKIKLYSNSSLEMLYFTALGDEKKLYQLFLFDMSGKLVTQARVRNSETALLSRFEKGRYMFEVFNNDDRIEYGSVVVK